MGLIASQGCKEMYMHRNHNLSWHVVNPSNCCRCHLLELLVLASLERTLGLSITPLAVGRAMGPTAAGSPLYLPSAGPSLILLEAPVGNRICKLTC